MNEVRTADVVLDELRKAVNELSAKATGRSGKQGVPRVFAHEVVARFRELDELILGGGGLPDGWEPGEMVCEHCLLTLDEHGYDTTYDGTMCRNVPDDVERKHGGLDHEAVDSRKIPKSAWEKVDAPDWSERADQYHDSPWGHRGKAAVLRREQAHGHALDQAEVIWLAWYAQEYEQDV